MKMKLTNIVSIIAFIVLLSSCGDETFIPKPVGYHKLELPEHKYTELASKHPYTFQHSVFAKAEKHKSAQASKDWIDINYPNFGASVQLTYKKLDSAFTEKNFETLIGDARKLTNKHNIKAYAIEEATIRTNEGVVASVFELEGDVPSQFQFYLTDNDSTKHFLRGALYFKHATKNDSLAPVIEYIKVDVIHMLNTLKWTE